MGIEFSEVLPLVGPIVAAAGLVSGVWWKVEGKIEKVRTDSVAAAAAAQAKAEAAKNELNEFKIKVVEEYASWETVRAIESRLTARMDSLSEQVVKMPEAVVDRIMKYMNLNPNK
jgi:hypothetical protein